MSKGKILIAIIGAGVVSSLTAAVGFFPSYSGVLIPATGLVAGAVALITGINIVKKEG